MAKTKCLISSILLQMALVHGYGGEAAVQGAPSTSYTTSATSSPEDDKSMKSLKKDWNRSRAKVEDLSILNEAITREGGEAATRIMKRQKARDLQDKAQTFTTVHGAAVTTMSTLLNTISIAGVPPIQGAATAGAIVIQAIQYTGQAISTLMFSVGRYKERSQEIITTNEQLIEAIQKSLETLDSLEGDMGIKKRKPTATQETEGKEKEPSKLKEFGKAVVGAGKTAYKAAKSAKEKIIEKTDFITNIKAGKLEETKKNQTALKAELENYEDLMRLLQIKLLQDDIKQIDKLLYIRSVNVPQLDKTGRPIIDKATGKPMVHKRRGTIETINEELNNLNAYLLNLQSNPKILNGKAKDNDKQMLKLYKRKHKLENDKVYYENYKEKTPEQLKADKAMLIKAIQDLEPLTKIGRSKSLQEKGIDADSAFSKDGVIELYEQVHSLRTALCSLPTKTNEIAALCAQK